MCVCVCVLGANFVTRKISRSVAKIHLGQLENFSLGNLDSKRDWGHAKDYVEVTHAHTQPQPHTAPEKRTQTVRAAPQS